ncbi:hypothetical protein ACFXI8_35350 [Streptomyces niveus]
MAFGDAPVNTVAALACTSAASTVSASSTVDERGKQALRRVG